MCVIRKPENVITDYVNSGILCQVDSFQNVVGSKTTFLDTVPYMFAARFNAQRQPPETCKFKLLKHSVLDCIDPRIGPNIQIITSFDNTVTDAFDMRPI